MISTNAEWEAREMAEFEASARQAAYDDVKDFFINMAEPGATYTLDDVVREAPNNGRKPSTEWVIDALSRLASEGIVRATAEGFGWIEEPGE